jgi:hypothetical protein
VTVRRSDFGLRNGSAYVIAVLGLLLFYLGYQGWFNPSRALKRQMGEIAAALSVPAGESEVARIARLAQLRQHLGEDIHVRAGDSEISSRDAVLGAVNAWKPPAAGIDVRFVDTQVFIDSDSAARAYMSVEVATPDPRGGPPIIDRQNTSVRLEKRNRAWLITTVESKGPPPLR